MLTETPNKLYPNKLCPYPKPYACVRYRFSQIKYVLAVAKGMRQHLGTHWCLTESGAVGPGILRGRPEDGLPFTVIAVAGPDVEKYIVVESTHNHRELNMWEFTREALAFLAECLTVSTPHPRL